MSPLTFAMFPKRVGDCLIEASENGCHGEAAVATPSGMKMAAIADPYGEHRVAKNAGKQMNGSGLYSVRRQNPWQIPAVFCQMTFPP